MKKCVENYQDKHVAKEYKDKIKKDLQIHQKNWGKPRGNGSNLEEAEETEDFELSLDPL